MFTDSLEPSGVGEHMLTLASELRSRYRISFVCPPTTQGLRFLERASGMGLNTFGIEAPYNTPALLDLYAWICGQHIDIFHCHAGITWEGFGGVEVARQARVPVVLRTEHLPYLLTHPVQRMDHRRTVEQVDTIICVSEASCASFIAAGVPAHKLEAVFNGVYMRPSEVNRSTALARVGIAPYARVVLTVGRFTIQKGHNWLLDAVPTVLQRHPDVHFLWVGEGTLRGELAEKVRSNRLDGHVHLAGRRDDVPDLLAASDLFVLPSHFEGLPIALLEAMASGLPVVGTQVSGTSEAVLNGVTGQLVEPGDVPALAAAIIAVLDNPSLASRWGAAGRKRVAEKFSASSMARKVDAVYSRLLPRAQQLEKAELLDRAQPGEARTAF